MRENPNYYAIIPAEVRYNKSLKDKAKLLYGEIVALSDKNGYCYASNRYFADLYEITLTTVSLLIKNLVDNGYIESEIIYKEGTKEILNRYLKIVKGGYLKNIKEGYLKKIKDNNTSINNTSINIKEYKEKFEELWKMYPNKKGKENAYKSFIKAIKDGTDIEIIKQGIEKYNDYIKNKKIEEKYIKHGSTWFNQKCWEDDYTIINNNVPKWFNKDFEKKEEVKITDEERIRFGIKD